MKMSEDFGEEVFLRIYRDKRTLRMLDIILLSGGHKALLLCCRRDLIIGPSGRLTMPRKSAPRSLVPCGYLRCPHQ